MSDISIKYPSFYLDLSSYLARYGDVEKDELPLESTTIPEQAPSSVMIGEEALPVIPPKRFNPDALFAAVTENDPIALKAILDKNAVAANVIEPSCNQPILLYTLRRRPLRFPNIETLVKLLVIAGSDVTAIDTQSQKSALHFLLEVFLDFFKTNRILFCFRKCNYTKIKPRVLSIDQPRT